MARIVIENVALDYPIFDGSRSFRSEIGRRIGGAVRRAPRSKHVHVAALDGLSAAFNEGDCVGLIGRNGSGKSTLLKVLAGVYTPTRGHITIDGQVSALLTIGLGMDFDDTGYDNILAAAPFMRLTKRQMLERIDEIAEFSELGEYLYMPMRAYSLGMQLRLAFAVATCGNPEILLLDEVLGAGDAQFATKAERRMHSFMNRASILVMASHADALIEGYCNKALWLDQGRMVAFGPTKEILARYREFSQGAA